MFIDAKGKRINIESAMTVSVQITIPDPDGGKPKKKTDQVQLIAGALRDPAVREQYGIQWIDDPVQKDDRFYYNHEIDEAPYLTTEPKPLEQFKSILLNQVNGACESAMAQLKAGYPESEVLSWSKQEAEARAFVANNSAATPLLDALATTRGVPKAELASRVVAKADLFAVLSGQIIGTRQALEDAINALPADATMDTHAEQINAIKWPEPEEEAAA